MRVELVLLALVLLGHLALFVLVVNVVHALGFTERRMQPAKILLLTWLLAGWGGIVYAYTRRPWAGWPSPLIAYAALCLAIAVVGLPVTSLRRARRRAPGGLSERTVEIDLAENHGRDSLIGTGRNSLLLRLPGNESLRLQKREWEVTVSTLPATWDGLSVTHLTDLHFAPCFQRRFFEIVADEAASWDSDLVLFTGDLLDHDATLDWIVPVLSRLRGRLGMFAILGNHDYNHDHERIRQLLEEAGFTDLEGRWSRLEIAGKTLALGGTSFPWGPPLDFRANADADFRILLSHSPDQYYRAVSSGIDLMFSGHNHGGQVRLPGLGPVVMPSVYSRRFDRGFFRSAGTLMHVGQGVGGKHPIRFGCVPELGRFVLRCPRSQTGAEAISPSRALWDSSGSFARS